MDVLEETQPGSCATRHHSRVALGWDVLHQADVGAAGHALGTCCLNRRAMGSLAMSMDAVLF